MTRWFAASLLLLALTACSREVRTDPEAVPEIVLSRVVGSEAGLPLGGVDPGARSAAAVPVTVASGTRLTTVLYSENDAEVRARTAGVVRAYLVDLGDAVATGQLLAAVEDERETAELESARAALELAELEHARALQLKQGDVITQAELDQAIYQLRSMQAALQEAAVRLEYTRVRAPFAGVVTRRFVRVGEAVDERTPLFRVTALRPLRAVVRVPEADASALAPGQILRLRAGDGVEVAGRIARRSPAVDPASGTIEILLDVPDPGSLRPGSAVSVDVSPRATSSAAE